MVGSEHIFLGYGWVELTGYFASFLVFLTFCMKTLIPLRIMAIISNLFFILYAFGADLTPVLLLHGALLPLNIYRTIEQLRVTQAVRKSVQLDATVDALVPFMRSVTYPAGSYLFQKGEMATTIFHIAKGTVQIPEINIDLSEGNLFGEMGLFTKSRLRTASARCITDCELHVISDTDIFDICIRNPAFGLFLTKLIASRMADNQERTAA